MDQMSFASVYRTAAILAAFSRGDAPRAEPARHEQPFALVVCPAVSLPERPALRHSLNTCWARVCAWRSKAAQQTTGNATDAHPTGWWVLQRPAIASRKQGRHRSPLISHFAFSEDADLHRTDPGPGASTFVR